MELHADEPGVILVFDDLRQNSVRRHAAEAHAALLEPALVGGVDLVAVAVTLGDLRAAIDAGDAAATLEHCRIRAEPPGAAEVAADAALLQFVALEPFGHQADDRLRRRSELGRVRLGNAAQIARGLDHCHLHAEADAEIRYVALARELCGADL